jgi:hypothetical protein
LDCVFPRDCLVEQPLDFEVSASEDWEPVEELLQLPEEQLPVQQRLLLLQDVEQLQVVEQQRGDQQDEELLPAEQPLLVQQHADQLGVVQRVQSLLVSPQLAGLVGQVRQLVGQHRQLVVHLQPRR